ncbi:MAG: MFS transporter [Crenarchaeota archaeon]|nr:MFS transporter [Thermoproteota archaeon]
MSDIACYTLIAQIVPTDHRGSAYGLLEFLLSIFSIPGPVVGSLIWKISPLYMFTVEGTLLIISILPIVLMRPQLKIIRNM